MPPVRARAVLLVIIALCWPGRYIAASENETGAWFIVNHGGPLGAAGNDGPWRYSLKAELRYFDIEPGVQQYIFQAGAGYVINDKLTVRGGYSYYGTDVHGGPSAHEHRAWQQLDWKIARWGRSEFNSRSRLEQRFFNGRDQTALWLRQRFTWVADLPRSENLRLLLGLESFHSLRDTPWIDTGLVQLRLSAGIRFEKSSYDVETGYMQQRRRIDGSPDLVNHLLVVSLRL